MFIKKFNYFGFSTVFSLIVIYFIFLYSSDRGWTALTFLSKWYLIIVGGLIALILGGILLILILSLLFFLVSAFRQNAFRKKYEKHRTKDCVDAEYELKE